MSLICVSAEDLTDLLRGRPVTIGNTEIRLTAEAECSVYEIVEDMKQDDLIEKSEQKYGEG